jgi:hypothetical protein
LGSFFYLFICLSVYIYCDIYILFYSHTGENINIIVSAIMFPEDRDVRDTDKCDKRDAKLHADERCRATCTVCLYDERKKLYESGKERPEIHKIINKRLRERKTYRDCHDLNVQMKQREKVRAKMDDGMEEKMDREEEREKTLEKEMANIEGREQKEEIGRDGRKQKETVKAKMYSPTRMYGGGLIKESALKVCTVAQDFCI